VKEREEKQLAVDGKWFTAEEGEEDDKQSRERREYKRLQIEK